MSLLPLQSTTGEPAKAADEDADALFAQARHLAQQGQHAAATAYAALATAAFTARAAAAAAPLPIHPGDHEPARTPWCEACRAPNSRLTPEGKPCPRCNTDRLRALRCRYCGVYLEKRPVHGPDEPWRWTDDYNSLSCPKAPHPLDEPGTPRPEQDVWPEVRWGVFFEQWHRSYGTEAVTAGQLSRDPDLKPYLPRTTYGDFHPAHLEHWLQERTGTTCAGFLVTEAHRAPPGDDARRWSITLEQTTADV
ncbi:hypothetical protein [Streptomyces sp. NPDC000983]|uniref:hypothetical protein n=1 Tax=Streptomyces sp. NPDC000983 TaxID=3154373 RepID=UPI003322F3C1